MQKRCGGAGRGRLVTPQPRVRSCVAALTGRAGGEKERKCQILYLFHIHLGYLWLSSRSSLRGTSTLWTCVPTCVWSTPSLSLVKSGRCVCVLLTSKRSCLHLCLWYVTSEPFVHSRLGSASSLLRPVLILETNRSTACCDDVEPWTRKAQRLEGLSAVTEEPRREREAPCAA